MTHVHSNRRRCLACSLGIICAVTGTTFLDLPQWVDSALWIACLALMALF